MSEIRQTFYLNGECAVSGFYYSSLFDLIILNLFLFVFHNLLVFVRISKRKKHVLLGLKWLVGVKVLGKFKLSLLSHIRHFNNPWHDNAHKLPYLPLQQTRRSKCFWFSKRRILFASSSKLFNVTSNPFLLKETNSHQQQQPLQIPPVGGLRASISHLSGMANCWIIK